MKGDSVANNTTNIVVSNMDKHPGNPSAPPSPIYVYHVQGQIFGYDEVNIDCPYCKIGITTKIKRKRGSYPWILCGILSVCGCFLCSCIPFCANNLKSVMFYYWRMLITVVDIPGDPQLPVLQEDGRLLQTKPLDVEWIKVLIWWVTDWSVLFSYLHIYIRFSILYYVIHESK